MRGLAVFSVLLTWALAATSQERDSTRYADSTAIPEVLRPEYQEVSQEELMSIIDQMPVFGVYLDNYFISGVPINDKITSENADAKYQVSFRHRITKTILPFNTALLLTYTQKSFWNVYEKSFPFRDSNFNPGLALAKPLAFNNKLWGVASLAIEHESNGRDSIYSRSWNYLTGTVTYFLNGSFSFNGKLWLGFLAEENKDLFDYKGYGFVATNYRTKNDHLRVSAIINPRKLGKFNTILEISFKPVSSLNQYLFLQWYQGYAENLLDYKDRTSMVRMGFCIKPDFRNFY